MGDLPFDMPKLKRRIRPASGGGINLAMPANISINSSGVSQGSSSHSVQQDDRPIGEFFQISLSHNILRSMKIANDNDDDDNGWKLFECC